MCSTGQPTQRGASPGAKSVRFPEEFQSCPARISRTFKLGTRVVKRLGYGAMQLAGPGVFGPPKDRDAALAVLREAVTSGVNHIDTSDFYGPHVTNRLIREALAPYREDLVIVTKIGAKRARMDRGRRLSRPKN
jgi:aryl-alcohol dehydrogenase-like predicted oxidoreductase